MTTSQRCVLMGDPAHFSVKGGANPHTRTRWGTRRAVDRELAIRQWQRLRDVLRDLGLRVLVVPPDPAQPGLVYPANAGFMQDVDAVAPLAARRFFLANLLPSRAGEKAHYRRVLEAEGVPCLEIDPTLRFEGEADFFPAGPLMLLTHGRVERQRFVPALALPPWRRVYGFRTDARVEPILQQLMGPEREILRIALVLEAHYHGDTALCAFGPGRRFLMAYRAALEPGAMGRLRERFLENLIEVHEEDAARYAANSFCYTPPGGSESFLVMPAGLSDRLLGAIRERRVTPIEVDVSEFLKKGGGSVKCMIGDLGPVAGDKDLGSAGNAGVGRPLHFRATPPAERGPSGVAAGSSAKPRVSVGMKCPYSSSTSRSGPSSLARPEGYGLREGRRSRRPRRGRVCRRRRTGSRVAGADEALLRRWAPLGRLGDRIHAGFDRVEEPPLEPVLPFAAPESGSATSVCASGVNRTLPSRPGGAR